MTKLFGKKIEALVGARRFTEHEISFDAKLSLSSDPDDAEIRLFNLSNSDRSEIESVDRNAQVVIFAGYKSTQPTPSY